MSKKHVENIRRRYMFESLIFDILLLMMILIEAIQETVPVKIGVTIRALSFTEVIVFVCVKLKSCREG